MKLIVPFVLIIVVGSILAAGCVAMTNKNTVNDTVGTTVAGFAPVSNTSDPGLNKTINATANSSSKLKGSLIVSIAGFSYPADLAVVLDNETVGTVNTTTRLFLMISEGNHTVMVCESSVCERENVTTGFGRYVTVDFSERLKRDGAFPDPIGQPTAQILGYYDIGNSVSVNVEFINPSTKDLLMSAVVSCGYSYIDDRSGFKMGDSARRTLVQNVKARQRITKRVDLYFASGYSYSYDSPIIAELNVK